MKRILVTVLIFGLATTTLARPPNIPTKEETFCRRVATYAATIMKLRQLEVYFDEVYELADSELTRFIIIEAYSDTPKSVREFSISKQTECLRRNQK